MGLSASQARLLSLTARISDNELHSQTVANSKVRLADKSQEASKEYIRSLNASKLVYTTYDAKGQQTELALTPSLMYQFSSLKNQYGISNTAGQLLISQFDAMNFENSGSRDEFIYKYGVSQVDNPKYIPALEAIYGENYPICYDSNSNPPGPTVGFGNLGVTNWLSSTPSMPSSQSGYNSWLNIATSSTLPPENTGVAGLYYNLLNHLNSPYAYPGDEPEEPVMPDFAALTQAYNGSACHDAVSDNGFTGIWHMEHNLCHLIWGTNGFALDENGDRIPIRNSANTIELAKNTNVSTNSAYEGHSPAAGTQQVAIDLLNGLENASQYQCVQDIQQDIIDLYCDLMWYMEGQNNYSESSGRTCYVGVRKAYDEAQIPNTTPTELHERWKQLYTDLANLSVTGQEEYEALYAEWQIEHAEWENTWHKIENWKETGLELYQEYQYALANLPPQHIPDPEDPRTEWYTNLWHRLNGPSENKSADGTGGKYYKVLEDNLYENADWLQFALEHGVVALEQVVYVENADITTGLEHSKWQHTIYSSAVDIVTVEDEVAIQIAEAKYNKTLKEIESKDKKYDMDIKKLDTEHNAMQQEYEALKSVIQKNAERSFKAFS